VRRAALAWVLAACCVLLSGCAILEGSALAPDAPGVMQARGVSPATAQAAVAIGKSTRAEVKSALGEGAVVRFDSGFEVWVYRWPGAQRTNRAATEFVVLFDPSGVVRKTRVRPGYGPEPKQ
jgi:hypothetical protein